MPSASFASRLLHWATGPSKSPPQGLTPLHIAAENGHTEVLECLLKERAEVRSVDHKGHSALLIAAEQGHHATVALLLAADLRGQRLEALQVAVERGASLRRRFWEKTEGKSGFLGRFQGKTSCF